MRIKIADNDPEFLSCFMVMRQLRLHLKDQHEFLERVKRQSRLYGYKLVFLEEGNVKAAAGIRISEFLAWGKIVYIDDLVTSEDARSEGYGKKLLSWIIDYAKENNCQEVHLDSGVQRFGAHRFYLNNRMDITSHHFSIKLE